MTKSTLFLLAISPFILFYMVGAFIGLQFNLPNGKEAHGWHM